jgi:hypothetical protein
MHAADGMGWIIRGLLLLLENEGPSGLEVISLQKVDSLLIFECPRAKKAFCK